MERCSVSPCRCPFPRHAGADTARLREEGGTSLVPAGSGNDLRCRRESLADLCGLIRAAGLEVPADPWGVARLFGGKAFPELLARHPEDRRADACGRMGVLPPEDPPPAGAAVVEAFRS